MGPVEQAFVVNDINCFHPIEPGLDVMSFRADVIMIPVSFFHQPVGICLGKRDHLAAPVLVPETAPVTIAHVHLITRNTIKIFRRDANADA